MSNEKQTTTIEDVARAILNGELDKHLDVIASVIKERRDVQARITFCTLQPGDRIRFKSSVRPKYLAGKLGTLVALRDKRVTVNLDGPSGRFNRGIVTPVTLIEKV
jgi:hypothetical protein